MILRTNAGFTVQKLRVTLSHRRLIRSVTKISREANTFNLKLSIIKSPGVPQKFVASNASGSLMHLRWLLTANCALNPFETNSCFLFLPIRTCSMLTTTGPLSCTRFVPLAPVAALSFSIIHQGSCKWESLSECNHRQSIHSHWSTSLTLPTCEILAPPLHMHFLNPLPFVSLLLGCDLHTVLFSSPLKKYLNWCDLLMYAVLWKGFYY